MCSPRLIQNRVGADECITRADGRILSEHSEGSRLPRPVHTQKTKNFPLVHTKTKSIHNWPSAQNFGQLPKKKSIRMYYVHCWPNKFKIAAPPYLNTSGSVKDRVESVEWVTLRLSAVTSESFSSSSTVNGDSGFCLRQHIL